MKVLARLASLTVLPLLLSGCLSFGNIQNRGASADQSIGVFQNRATLMNLVRASRGEPLYFLSLGSITASATTDLKLAPPVINEGPGFSKVQMNQYALGGSSNVLDNSTLTSFQLNLLNTKDFYTGMMSPVQWNDINLLIRQGFPREIIFYLVVDKAKFTPIVNGKADESQSFFLYNNPSYHAPIGPNHVDQFTAFQIALTRAMMAGATTDTPAPNRGGAEHEGADRGAGTGAAAAKDETPPQIVGQAAAPNGKGDINFVLKQQQDNAAPSARLCFERIEASPEIRADFAALEAMHAPPVYCGTPKGSGFQVLMVDVGPPGHPFKLPFRVDIYTRSISSMFTYLGAMVRDPSLAPIIGLGPDRTGSFTPPGDEPVSGPLISVKANGFGDCFSSVTYAHLIWCAPQDGAAARNTRVVFNILTDLVATKQSPGDLPASSTVLLTP